MPHSFFGTGAGARNTTACCNAMFGSNAGQFNTTGERNTFIGSTAGSSNTTGGSNSFFGKSAGASNQTGNNNTFIGASADFAGASGTGDSNTLLGAHTNVGSSDLTNATALGANAQVTQNNSLVLGSINGVNGATTNTNVGIGTTAPRERLEVRGGNIYVGSAGQGIVLKSPNGSTCRLLSIDNAGNLVVAASVCP